MERCQRREGEAGRGGEGVLSPLGLLGCWGGDAAAQYKKNLRSMIMTRFLQLAWTLEGVTESERERERGRVC